MKLLSIASAVVWVDFITIILSKFFHLGRSLDKWYQQFGIVAVVSDCLVIVLGILLALILFPDASVKKLIVAVIIIQLIHDILLYKLVIEPLPLGTNKIIDLFKEYANENSWKILVADSIMISSTIVFANYLDSISSMISSFIGLLGIYSLSYIIYTK